MLSTFPRPWSGRTLYQEAATYCHSVKDYVSRDLSEELMHDEEEPIDFLETQIDLVAKSALSFTLSNTLASPTGTDETRGMELY